MQIDDGGSYSLKGTIHPKIEPEIAFIAAKELSGQVSVEDVFAAIDGVCAALEILDSRYKGFQYFSLPDVVADNSSSSMFIIGKPVKNFRSLDLARLAMRFQVNGELAHEAQSSAISGNPLLSVVALCELLAKRKQSIPKGSLILAGAATAAVSLEAGMKVELHVDGLPGVSVSMAL
jgi:2-oxo-3-hexenedioate decarboxylase